MGRMSKDSGSKSQLYLFYPFYDLELVYSQFCISLPLKLKMIMLSQFCPELCYQQTKLQAVLFMLSLEVLKDELARKSQQFASLNILLTNVPQDSDPLPQTGMCFADSRHTQQLLLHALPAITEVNLPQPSGVTEWSQPCTWDERLHFIH